MSKALSANFDEPFSKQAAFFRAKLGNQVPTEKWTDMQKNAHDKAFTVAGAMKADLLADLAQAVDKALLNGGTLQTFRADFADIVKKHGWDYNGEFNWRTKTIYMTNLRTSMAAGRLAQLEEGGYPYWVYRHSGSANPRHQHKAWNGLTLPADDPFWRTHYPPNGWGCGCYAVGIRKPEDARRYGGDGKLSPRPVIQINPRTGTPVGIDKGWDYMPGRTWQQFDQNAFVPDCSWSSPLKLSEPFDASKPHACIKPVGNLKAWRDEGRPDVRDVPAEHRLKMPELLIKQETTDDALRALADELGVSPDNPIRWIQTKAKTVSGNPFPRLKVSYEYLRHLVEKRKDMRERFAPLIIPTLEDPYEIWTARYSDNTIRSRYIGLFSGRHNMMTVVRINKDGSILYNIIPSSDENMNRQRKGILVYGK